MIKKTIF